jgi:hypothetical protein
LENFFRAHSRSLKLSERVESTRLNSLAVRCDERREKPAAGKASPVRRLLFLPSDLVAADVQHQGEADLFPGKGGELWASLWQEA